jgi:hypothetical protein
MKFKVAKGPLQPGDRVFSLLARGRAMPEPMWGQWKRPWARCTR